MSPKRMKFQLSALVAALAIFAAVPAQATLQLAGSGDSSLVLTLLDSTKAVSATFDLGPTFTTFDRAVSQSWDLTTADYSAAWSAFNDAASSNKQWGVYVADGTGNAALAQQRLVTAGTAAGLNNVILNTNLNQSAALFDTFLTASQNIVSNGNSILNNHGTVSNGSNFVSGLPSTNAAFAGSVNAYGATGKIANSGSDSNGAFDTDLFVWTITRSSSSLLNIATSAKLNVNGSNPYFNLSSNGTLIYWAPLPETESPVMFLIGLCAIGFLLKTTNQKMFSEHYNN